MTELSPPDEPAAAQPTREWPQSSQSGVSDGVVQLSLAHLQALPEAPVAEHEALYNQLYEELRAALDADPDADRDGGA